MLLPRFARNLIGRPVHAARASTIAVAICLLLYYREIVTSWNIGILPSQDRRQPELADRIDALRAGLAGNYTMEQYMYARQLNEPSLARLSGCMRRGDCGSGEDKVVIFASTHFSNMFIGATSGEAIWANSTFHALSSLNITMTWAFTVDEALMIYQHIPELVRVIIWQSHLYQNCVRSESTEDTKLDAWRGGDRGCIRTPSFPQGIPVWKSFVWHFWIGPQTVLGPRWTLSPEDYGEDNGQFLGYSIESECETVPFNRKRLHQGLVLGKEKSYFQEEKSMFFGLLQPIEERVPKDIDGNSFQFFAHVYDAPQGRDHLPEPGLENRGSVTPAEFAKAVSESKFMLGVGKPSTSPSPYYALCFGTPFINPIIDWDRKNPDDKAQWQMQHRHLTHIPEPYVYTVRRGDEAALGRAVRMAVDNPIERYYIPTMRRSAVRERHRILIETDWYSEAQNRAKGEILKELGVELLL